MTSGLSSSTAFWEQTEAQLAETPPDVAVERDPFYSQPEWDVFRMHYASSGGHRLFAWLSVPHGDGPFPALVRMPDYASVHDIIYTSLRHHAVVMNPTYRGQRNSDGLVRAAYPGLLTEGIESPETYTLLGAYADALRAVDVLLDQRQARIETVGSDRRGSRSQPGIGGGGPPVQHLGGGRGYADGIGTSDGVAAGARLPPWGIGRLPACQSRAYGRRRANSFAGQPVAFCWLGFCSRADERGPIRPLLVSDALCRRVGRCAARLRPARV